MRDLAALRQSLHLYKRLYPSVRRSTPLCPRISIRGYTHRSVGPSRFYRFYHFTVFTVFTVFYRFLPFLPFFTVFTILNNCSNARLKSTIAQRRFFPTSYHTLVFFYYSTIYYFFLLCVMHENHYNNARLIYNNIQQPPNINSMRDAQCLRTFKFQGFHDSKSTGRRYIPGS